MRAQLESQGPSDEGVACVAQSDGPDALSTDENRLTLSALPIGARLIVRGRKDWRAATVAAVTVEMVTLSIGSPSGHTYRLRRSPDTLLYCNGAIPLLGEGDWRAGFARYDTRW